ncbi:MAG TPA: STAS domain-containing protein [Aquabacterium sp.]|nr:STAS domain-containing protein [Aquabacterium sp.]
MELVVETAEAGGIRLCVQGDCNIYGAGELKAALLSHLQARPDLEIDLASVTEIDTAGIQVLMAAKQYSRTRGQELRLVQHSAPVLELIEIYDLAVWLGDPLIVSAARPDATA